MVTIPIALLGGSYNERVEVAERFAKLLGEWSEDKNIMVMLVDAPPKVLSSNEWVNNDMALRVVMFNERQKYMEFNHRITEGEFDYAIIITVESAYALIAEAMFLNSKLSAGMSGTSLLGADGQPLSKDAYLVNQLAGGIMYARGLVPYILGRNGDFYSGGVWMLGTDEPEAAVVERLVSTGADGQPLVQKVPQGTDSQIRRHMEVAVLEGMEVPYAELPVGAEVAAERLFLAVTSLLEAEEGEDVGEESATSAS